MARAINKNHYNPVERRITPSSAVLAGEVYVGDPNGLGIVIDDIAANATGSVAFSGAYDLPKTAGEAWTRGSLLYWDASAESLTTTALDNEFFGRAYFAAESASTRGVGYLLPFSDEPPREVTLAATGAQIIGAENFRNGKALHVNVPNTAALTTTFPAMSTVPLGMSVVIQKSSADAEIVTIAANAADAVLGTTGQIDAEEDTVAFVTTADGPLVTGNSIA